MAHGTRSSPRPPLAALGAILAAAAAVACAAPDRARDARPELMVYAAASLRDVLEDLAPAAETEVGVRLVFSFAGSNDLVRQIEAGAKADVFFSADITWMDRLGRGGRIDAAHRVPLLSNRLVIVAPAASPLPSGRADVLASPEVRRVAVADPEAVPAGTYARAWLRSAGVWESVRDKIVPALDVRAALAAVESGATDAGIVYATDARTSRRVRVLLEVSEQDAPRISYVVAPIATRPALHTARRYVDWLGSPRATEAFERAGFTITASRSPR